MTMRGKPKGAMGACQRGLKLLVFTVLRLVLTAFPGAASLQGSGSRWPCCETLEQELCRKVAQRRRLSTRRAGRSFPRWKFNRICKRPQVHLP